MMTGQLNREAEITDTALRIYVTPYDALGNRLDSSGPFSSRERAEEFAVKAVGQISPYDSGTGKTRIIRCEIGL